MGKQDFQTETGGVGWGGEGYESDSINFVQVIADLLPGMERKEVFCHFVKYVET
mgnify:CR=1 FL=1